MAAQMLDDMYHGICRDVGAEVAGYLYDHVWTQNVPVNYDHVDQAIVTAIHTTEKPHAVTHELWDEMIENFRIGVEVGIEVHWPFFPDANIVDYDDIIVGMLEIMRAVLLRVTRATGQYMLNEIVESDRAATRIQTEWRDAIANPSRGLCRRRLAREFRDLCAV